MNNYFYFNNMDKRQGCVNPAAVCRYRTQELFNLKSRL